MAAAVLVGSVDVEGFDLVVRIGCDCLVANLSGRRDQPSYQAAIQSLKSLADDFQKWWYKISRLEFSVVSHSFTEQSGKFIKYSDGMVKVFRMTYPKEVVRVFFVDKRVFKNWFNQSQLTLANLTKKSRLAAHVKSDVISMQARLIELNSRITSQIRPLMEHSYRIEFELRPRAKLGFADEMRLGFRIDMIAMIEILEIGRRAEISNCIGKRPSTLCQDYLIDLADGIIERAGRMKLSGRDRVRLESKLDVFDSKALSLIRSLTLNFEQCENEKVCEYTRKGSECILSTLARLKKVVPLESGFKEYFESISSKCKLENPPVETFVHVMIRNAELGAWFLLQNREELIYFRIGT